MSGRVRFDLVRKFSLSLKKANHIQKMEKKEKIRCDKCKGILEVQDNKPFLCYFCKKCQTFKCCSHMPHKIYMKALAMKIFEIEKKLKDKGIM